MGKRITVTGETQTGENIKFHDNYLGIDMTKPQFINAIDKGKYPNYFVNQTKDGNKYPSSKPDSSKNNNLG